MKQQTQPTRFLGHFPEAPMYDVNIKLKVKGDVRLSSSSNLVKFPSYDHRQSLQNVPSSEIRVSQERNLQNSCGERYMPYSFANNIHSRGLRSSTGKYQQYQRRMRNDQLHSSRKIEYSSSYYSSSAEKEEFVEREQQRDNENQEEGVRNISKEYRDKSKSVTTQAKLSSKRSEQIEQIRKRREQELKKNQLIQRANQADAPPESKQCQVQEKPSLNIHKSFVNVSELNQSGSEFLFCKRKNLQISSDERKYQYLIAKKNRSRKDESIAAKHQRNQLHMRTDQPGSCGQFEYSTSSSLASQEKDVLVQQKDDGSTDQESADSSSLHPNGSNSEKTQNKLSSKRLEQIKLIRKRREKQWKKKQ